MDKDIREPHLRWNEAHREELREYSRRYREAHRKEIKESNSLFRDIGVALFGEELFNGKVVPVLKVVPELSEDNAISWDLFIEFLKVNPIDSEVYRLNAEAYREEVRESNRKYREAHREELKESHRRYNEDNREKVKESSRKYREAHREELKESSRRYYEANVEEQRANRKLKRMLRKVSIEGVEYELEV